MLQIAPLLHHTRDIAIAEFWQQQLGDRMADETKERDRICLSWAGDRSTAKFSAHSKRIFFYGEQCGH